MPDWLERLVVAVARRAVVEVLVDDVDEDASEDGSVVVQVVDGNGRAYDYDLVLFTFLDAYMGRLEAIEPLPAKESERRDLAIALAAAAAAPLMLDSTVERLRDAHGWSWSDIAAVAGITRQAAAQRWGRRPAR